MTLPVLCMLHLLVSLDANPVISGIKLQHLFVLIHAWDQYSRIPYLYAKHPLDHLPVHIYFTWSSTHKKVNLLEHFSQMTTPLWSLAETMTSSSFSLATASFG